MYSAIGIFSSTRGGCFTSPRSVARACSEPTSCRLDKRDKRVPHLRVGRPTHDRVEIGGEGTDQTVMLRRNPPNLPPRAPAGGEVPQKCEDQGRMDPDLP